MKYKGKDVDNLLYYLIASTNWSFTLMIFLWIFVFSPACVFCLRFVLYVVDIGELMCTYSTYLCLGLYPVLLFWYFFAQEISLFFEVYPSSSRPFTLEIYFSKQLLFHFKGVCLKIFHIQFLFFTSNLKWIAFRIIGWLFFLIHMNFLELDVTKIAIQFDFFYMDTIHF